MGDRWVGVILRMQYQKRDRSEIGEKRETERQRETEHRRFQTFERARGKGPGLLEKEDGRPPRNQA